MTTRVWMLAARLRHEESAEGVAEFSLFLGAIALTATASLAALGFRLGPFFSGTGSAFRSIIDQAF